MLADILKNYRLDIATPKLQTSELQRKQQLRCQNLPTRTSMFIFPVAINASGGSKMARERPINASELAASTLPDYKHKLAYQGPKISSSTNNFKANGVPSSPKCG